MSKPYKKQSPPGAAREPTTPQLHVAVGIPGSGKSTLFSNMLEEDELNWVISTDVIRAQLIEENAGSGQHTMGDDPYWDHTIEPRVWGKAHDELAYYLEVGMTVGFDATNLKPDNRRTLLDIAHEAECWHTFAHLFVIDFSLACERNMARERTVPAAVMKRMQENYEKFCSPATLEAEGFKVVIHDEGGD